MPIKDKHGNVYKLRGPNPIMNQQQEWDKSKVAFFNLGYKSEVVTDTRNPKREFEEKLINISDDLGLYEGEDEGPMPQFVEPEETKVLSAKQFLREIEETPVPVPTPKVEEPPIKLEENEPVVLNVDAKTARILRDRGEEYHCAPAIGEKVHKDALYGSSYTTTRYGEKFIFDAVVVDVSDFQLQIWSVRHVPKGSIIYRKDPEGGERWWRINEVEPKSSGYLAIANISELNPDFS